MLHGCQRRVIVLKDTGDPRFEEAYVVLRGESAPLAACATRTMVEAARDILREEEPGTKTKRAGGGKTFRAVMVFAAGMVLSFLLSAGLYVIFLR